MCGKNSETLALPKALAGSPPRVREKQWYSEKPDEVNGITPACAGKTFCECLRLRYRWDHPRVCGKNSPKNLSNLLFSGSPPRVREKPLQSGMALMTARDHPRVCGKNFHTPRKICVDIGSPPRVREKLHNI